MKNENINENIHENSTVQLNDEAMEEVTGGKGRRSKEDAERLEARNKLKQNKLTTQQGQGPSN